MTRLFVNVDHVATIREARKTVEPDPLMAAQLAERAGADGITVHLREDRRHIQDHDLYRIRSAIKTKLNLEMAPVEEMVRIALESRPYQVSLVPEKRQEITTEGGLDVFSQIENLIAVKNRLQAGGILFSLFVDPDPKQIAAAAKVGADSIEINTGAYSELNDKVAVEAALSKIREAAMQASALKLRVFAGHGLTCENVKPIAEVSEIEELNIGHHIVSRAVFCGMENAVREMILTLNQFSSHEVGQS
ncbi:MAG: pyridoxine 5'-phosphate synthase [Nitrospinaceae bacterium]|nr:MAG: pyridoxine 5'-phosphate synthase [Nitrospinaceae bacterium]